MKIAFMWENHLFSQVGNSLEMSREALMERARNLFTEEAGGSLFARSADGSIPLHLSGRCITEPKGVTAEELSDFFNRVEEYDNWIARC